METIVIDENYEGIYKYGWYFKIDVDIKFPNAKIEIKIPLVSSRSILGKSLKVYEWLEVGESLEVYESLEVRESLEVYKWLRVGKWLEVGKSLKVYEWLEVGESLEVGGSLEVYESLEVFKWLKVGKSLSIFGEKTTKYMLLVIDTYQVILTTSFIKIGCQLHKVEEWNNYKDKQISAMDGQKALDWWKTWKDFILSTHKNLPETFKI